MILQLGFGTANMASSVILSFFYSWRLAMLGAALSPIVIYFSAAYARLDGGGHTINKAVAKTAGLEMEAISNIRTVVGLGMEPAILNMLKGSRTHGQGAPHRK